VLAVKPVRAVLGAGFEMQHRGACGHRISADHLAGRGNCGNLVFMRMANSDTPRPGRRREILVAVVVTACICFTAQWLLHVPKAPEPVPPRAPTYAVPSPELGPDAVIDAVLYALKTNNEADDGIAVVFSFASPRNQAVTGPLPRFIAMVKSPPYRPMIGFEQAQIGPLQVSGDAARQTVVLYHRHRPPAMYTFVLSRQTATPWKGCWMTDAVFPGTGPEPTTAPGEQEWL